MVEQRLVKSPEDRESGIEKHFLLESSDFYFDKSDLPHIFPMPLRTGDTRLINNLEMTVTECIPEDGVVGVAIKEEKSNVDGLRQLDIKEVVEQSDIISVGNDVRLLCRQIKPGGSVLFVVATAEGISVHSREYRERMQK